MTLDQASERIKSYADNILTADQGIVIILVEIDRDHPEVVVCSSLERDSCTRLLENVIREQPTTKGTTN